MNSRREEVMRRLGVEMCHCPECGTAFKLSCPQKHVILAFRDGELYSSGRAADDLLCSPLCAERLAKKLNDEEQHGIEYTPFTAEDPHT